MSLSTCSLHSHALPPSWMGGGNISPIVKQRYYTTKCVIYIWKSINLLLMKKTSTRSGTFFPRLFSPQNDFDVSFRIASSGSPGQRHNDQVVDEWRAIMEEEESVATGVGGSGSQNNKYHIRETLTFIKDQCIGALSQNWRHVFIANYLLRGGDGL